MARSISKSRWDKLMNRMTAYGIGDLPLTAIPSNITEVSKEPAESAARMMTLLATAFSASNTSETDRISDWLKTETLWQSASESEKLFFREHGFSDEEKAKLSFRFEGAYMMAWLLNLVDIFPDPSAECDAELVSEFFENVPPLLGETAELFDDLRYRKMIAIHDEYLFYKMTQLYFKHIKALDKENTCNVHEAASRERFFVLEWLVNEDDLDWEEVAYN